MKKMNKGFTLVELIIVIAILAIIMLIAIPNFSGIQQRMQVRADKATAAQIGKAVRVWFTDYTTDTGMLTALAAGSIVPADYDKNADGTIAEANDLIGLPVGNEAPVNYEELANIHEYISKGQKPSSLKPGNVEDETQFYGVVLTKDATNTASKIAVVITNKTGSPAAPVAVDVTAVTAANYDGTAAGVAYIEP